MKNPIPQKMIKPLKHDPSVPRWNHKIIRGSSYESKNGNVLRRWAADPKGDPLTERGFRIVRNK